MQNPDETLDEPLIVETKKFKLEQPFTMASNTTLDNVEIVYQCYGELNADKSNAILICHALNGHQHVTGKNHEEDTTKGWWQQLVGPGKAIDTNKYFVVCPNNIGGCNGSTGPSSINPDTNQFWGADFPHIRIRDWVNSQRLLQQHLDIEKWLAVVGGSLGGMQAMRWSIDFPDAIRGCVVLASTMCLDAQNIAFNEIARKAILMDQDYVKGDYLNQQRRPIKGLAIARMMANMSYNTAINFNNRFGRNLRSGDFSYGEEENILFEVESYVSYKAEQFASSFDANSYIYITKMLDLFDLSREYNGDTVATFNKVKAKFLVVSFSSDWRFSPSRSWQIANSLQQANKRVAYSNIKSEYGHDAFLMANPEYEKLLSTFLYSIDS